MPDLSKPFLDTEINFLKGVGPDKVKVFEQELGIRTYEDLLRHFPFRYIDRTRIYKVNEISADLPFVQLKGKITNFELIGNKPGNSRLVAQFSDGAGVIELVWFKGIKWIAPKLKPNIEFIVFGKPTLFNGRYNIAHPDLEMATDENIKLASKLMPVYSTGENLRLKWLDSKGIWKLERTLVALINKNIPETLSEEVIRKLRLIPREEALKIIHQPDNLELLAKAELRLKFEELFFLQLRLLQIKGTNKKTYKGFSFSSVGNIFNDFYQHHLPFQLTNAQKKVIKEIRADMDTGEQMNRLLQGDVGSGKTVVALLSILIALDNGFQACLMAPTEILANQHFKNLSKLLESTNITIQLLTGSTKQSDRKLIHEQLQSGELNIIVGTHALIEDKVQFNKLGFVVVDEQHKFGVAQRSKLWRKSTVEAGENSWKPPHILVMTATPIPRTLAMTIYGDLDVSVIDELPPGRKPVKTVHRYEAKILDVFQFMKQEIKKGRQVYVVYPIIEESKILDYRNLEEGFELIKKYFPDPQFSLAMVHGRLKNNVKDAQMQLFAEGKAQILVATTVIEVGVDVPNASLMIINSAERFGLSQLHQLRGRVGRGAEESYCILMTGYKLGANSRTRIETMVQTSNGFEIAEVDLKLRGPGDMSGTQQSGMIDFKIANLVKDGQILRLARDAAKIILNKDLELTLPENLPMLNELNRIKKAKPYWGRIS